MVFSGTSIDSREVSPGELFVPIVAERDGHDFVASAVETGAAVYLLEKGRGLPVPETAATAIEVDDTSLALTQLGRFARTLLPDPVIAITGSVGKTSVKDLTLAACRTTRRTHASVKSFNNELGVPLTLVNAPDDTELTIVEMGARGKGHIAELVEIARPTIGMVTRVALAHSELFGNIEGVAAAKGEMIEGLIAEGTAVLNADDANVAAMARLAPGRVLTFGCDRGDVRAENVVLDELLRPSFSLVTPAGTYEVKLPVMGAHMALNAAGAMAAALAAGVDPADAAGGLEASELSPWRMEVARAANGLIVINDAYNANPTSMRAAIDALMNVPASDRVAVVGAMAELGDEGVAEHEAIADLAHELGVRLFAVDAPDYGASAVHVPTRAQVRAALGELGDGVAILVKGSRVAGLEAVAADLLAESS